jgi:hypothetical protein
MDGGVSTEDWPRGFTSLLADEIRGVPVRIWRVVTSPRPGPHYGALIPKPVKHIYALAHGLQQATASLDLIKRVQ